MIAGVKIGALPSNLGKENRTLEIETETPTYEPIDERPKRTDQPRP